jgi:hypothetical protein
MGAKAVLMAFCMSWMVANVGLLLGAAPTGALATTSKDITSSTAVTERILVLCRKLLRLRDVRYGAVYLPIANTSSYGLIITRFAQGAAWALCRSMLQPVEKCC